MSENAAQLNRDTYTVTRLNREVKGLLESHYPLLWVEGEVSNLSRPASGHLYFTLKDKQSQVRCALFRGHQRAGGTAMRDGLQVIVRARISLYEGRGDYQLIIETVEDAGEGALRRAFEELKQRLLVEGLFDQKLKKPLPRVPRRIGVLTSPSGAVFHDIIKTLQRRFPAIPVLLYPVPVQGIDAAEKISTMLALAGRRNECDALILARGGGSLEDLQAFNSEAVARAIHACPLPVVAGVGHETDVTIADFVADARAPTPTAAAELLSPDRSEWLHRVQTVQRRLLHATRSLLDDRHQHLDLLRARLVHPQQRLGRLLERLASQARHLTLLQQQARHHANQRLQHWQSRLLEQNPRNRVVALALRHHHAAKTLSQTARHAIQAKQQQLGRLSEILSTLSPLATLARGYAILSLPVGQIISDARTLQVGDPVEARLAKGVLSCRIEAIRDEKN